MNQQEIIRWLLDGDVSIQYQTTRDLLGNDNKLLQDRIAIEGWGKRFLSKRNASGNWSMKFYQPKWTSTHYTLLDLRNLNLNPEINILNKTIELILNSCKASDGGIALGPSTSSHSDICVNGMVLNYASYFKTNDQPLHSIIDCILGEIMADGGFNCRSNRSGAKHSSLHTTLSVIEGFTEYIKNKYRYRIKDVEQANKSSIAFILQHQLFISDRTGEIINKGFLKFPYPSRWKYDILRALDYFQYEGIRWDHRMEPALQVLLKKRNKDGTWNLNAKHPGREHFEME